MKIAPGFYAAAAIWLIAAAPGLSGAAEPASPRTVPVAEAETPAKLESIEVGATRPAHRFGRFHLAGQPAPEDLPKWKALGVRTVINLRMPNETDWDERAAVEGFGMKYISIPFAGPDTLTNEKIKKSLTALRTGHLSDQSKKGASDEKKSKPKPVLLHCSTSNRVGAIWYAHRILHDDADADAALEEAKRAGLRTMGYLEPVDKYIEQARADE